MFPSDVMVRVMNDEREREVRETVRLRALVRHDREAGRPHLPQRAERTRR